MKKWTNEKLMAEATKYLRSSDWERGSRSSYFTAQRLGLLPQMTAHMIKRKKWDLESASAEAKKHKFRSDFKKAAPAAYVVLAKHKKIDIFFKERKVFPLFWTKEKIKAKAVLFQTRGEWQKNHRKSYDIAHRNGWLEEMSCHMHAFKRVPTKWNREAVLADAKKYNTKSEWWTHSNGAHLSARNNGWFAEATAHMKACGNSSKEERLILNFIKQWYPEASKKRFRNNNLELFFSKSFELDVFVPSLNKGIEFDGKHWHSEEMLAKRLNRWPKDEVKFYHEKKDRFFSDLNISVLHIKELDWKKNSSDCLAKIRIFLGLI